MWIHLTCMKCETERKESILCEIEDDGVYRAECRHGHKILSVLQNLKYEILFESGATAMLVGFRREAVASFYVALERFLEFGIRVLLRYQSVPDVDVNKAWSGMANQSQRQLGAFLLAYLMVFKEPFQRIEDLAELRNKIVHQGYIPTRDEAKGFGRRVFDIIESTQLRLQKGLPEAFEMVSRTRSMEGHRKLQEAGDVPVQEDGGWSWGTTHYIGTALSPIVTRERPRSFDDAIQEIERRLPWYGHPGFSASPGSDSE